MGIRIINILMYRLRSSKKKENYVVYRYRISKITKMYIYMYMQKNEKKGCYRRNDTDRAIEQWEGKGGKK